MAMEKRRDELLHQAAVDYLFGSRTQAEGAATTGRSQPVPVNVYETADEIVITAPRPGVEADNIDVEVRGTTVRLRAALRGPGQMERKYLVHEWTYGPYERVIDLPVEVDAERANASHANGVLVLTLPKATHVRPVRIQLTQQTSQRSGRQGHSGRHPQRTRPEPE
jgi:HSP20 family protein